MFSSVLLLLLAAHPAQQADGVDLPSLLAPAPAPAAPLDADLAMQVERRHVRVDFSVLQEQAFTIELFGGAGITARQDRIEQYQDGVVWVGSVDEDPNGDVFLSWVGGALTATLRFQDRLYRVSPAEEGPVHYLARLDEDLFPECGTSASHGINLPGVEQHGGNGTRAGAPDIDVMVVYTSLARSNQGGVNAMASLINLAVSETNDGYSKSDVDQRLVLVYKSELGGYTENGNFSTELSRLRGKNDGYMDGVHPNRDNYGADCVAMIVNSSQYCGIAYLMTNVSHNFESNAFSVTARTCATGYYSFGHELGHNMGSTHDHQNASSGAYSYSFGWRTSNSAWRTIMAYSPGTRIRYFSNPNKFQSGYALGQVNYAENWRSLNNTASTVADWRPTAGGTQYDLILTINSPLVAGTTTDATVTGSAWLAEVYVYNGSGLGSTTIPGLGVDLEIANARQVYNRTADSSGTIQINRFLPAQLSGRAVYLQVADTLARLSEVTQDTIQ